MITEYPNGTKVETIARSTWPETDIMIKQTVSNHPQSADFTNYIMLNVDEAKKLIAELIIALEETTRIDTEYNTIESERARYDVSRSENTCAG